MSEARLLLVEDEDVVRSAMAEWLGRAGYSADDVGSGEEALERLKQREYDLLLVNVKLPGMDGLEFLRLARQQNHRSGALVITGYGSADSVIESIDVGAEGFMMKPFSPEDLLLSVRSALTRLAEVREAQRLIAYRPPTQLTACMLDRQDLSETSDSFLSNIVQTTGAGRSAIFLRKKDALVLFRSVGFHGELNAGGRAVVQRLDGLLGQSNGAVKSSGGALSWPDMRPAGTRASASLCFPLHSLGHLSGLVLVEHEGPGHVFSRGDVEFLWISCCLLSGIVAHVGDEEPAEAS